MILSVLNEKKLLNSSYAEIKIMMDYIIAEKKSISEEHKELKFLIIDAEKEFDKLDPKFVNKLNTNRIIARQVKKFTELKVDADGKIRDTITHVSHLVKFAEAKYNKNILAAKRSDSKTNRLALKTEVMRFYRNNAVQLKTLFDLMNTLIEIKQYITKRI
jgi:hypothetical protein